MRDFSDQKKNRTMPDAEESLAVRAAWLHYAGGLTQSEVARRLGLPSVKTHRLIARAVADGVVKVSIDGDIVECVELENRLAERFGLQYCEVIPSVDEDESLFRTLGNAGANFLKREIERGDHAIIGLGHGRTLATAVQMLPRVSARDLRFVSLLGGLTRNYAANPFDVMHRIAEKTGMQAYVMPVPFFANTADDREVLLAQRGVKEVLDLANRATLKLVGLGTVDTHAQLVQSGMIEAKEIEDVAASGAVGEMLGYFFDADGRTLETTLTSRTLSAALPRSKTERLVALAGGREKIRALRAVLNSRSLNGLITDEQTAESLLQ
jgi:DNA-binding transcriptional regulator LsrR (DeoR family)